MHKCALMHLCQIPFYVIIWWLRGEEYKKKRKIPRFSLLLCGSLCSIALRVRVDFWRHVAGSSFHYADINTRSRSCTMLPCLALFSASDDTAEATSAVE